MTQHLSIVADIGGTNTRVALAKGDAIVTGSVERFRNAGNSGLEPILASYLRARDIQSARYEELGQSFITNAQASHATIEKVAEADQAGKQLLQEAAEKLKFSARGFHRILKVARTLADLGGEDKVGRIHLAEAISYRTAGHRFAETF